MMACLNRLQSSAAGPPEPGRGVSVRVALLLTRQRVGRARPVVTIETRPGTVLPANRFRQRLQQRASDED
jgi:hypothetical protein